jgi:NAD-dependent DNA ligase
MSAIQAINTFKTEGINALENIPEQRYVTIIQKANDAYYNNKPLMTDNEFDIVKEYFEKKFPNNPVLQTIGAPITKNKVSLPYNMPSMDKIKPDTDALDKWMKKYTGNYVLSCKLDGVSGMYTTEDNTQKLYTRGDGTIGQDITHLLPALNLPKVKDIVVRGEFIISRTKFEEKYKSRFANPRNLVAGIINSKTIDNKIHDMDFVAYEVIKPVLCPSDQMKLLEKYGFNTVRNLQMATLTNELLSQLLIDWRSNYEYEIDGIIVSNNKKYARTEKNPEHSFAFKMVISDQVAEAKVVDVIWNASKSGYLKPRVRIEPIHIGGVKIEYATGFNGKFIESNKIGIGAVIQLIRSGDVIPYIKSVTTEAEQAKMPNVPYHWNETNVDIILDNIEDDTTVKEKNITSFFVGIQVEGLSTGNVKRLMNAGYDSILKIIHMKKEDYEGIEGFQTKMINKIYNGIQERLKESTLVEIIAASNLLGRGIGKRKLEPIFEKYPNLFTLLISNEELKVMLLSVNGIGEENARSIVENMKKMKTFLAEANLLYKLCNEQSKQTIKTKKSQTEEDHILHGKNIVMTKVRDASIISALSKYGGKLENNITKNTFALITKSHDDVSSKTKKANELGIPIMTPLEFIEKIPIIIVSFYVFLVV